MSSESLATLIEEFRALGCESIAALIAWTDRDPTRLPVQLTLRVHGAVLHQESIDSPAGYFRATLAATSSHPHRSEILSFLDRAAAQEIASYEGASKRTH